MHSTHVYSILTRVERETEKQNKRGEGRGFCLLERTRKERLCHMLKARQALILRGKERVTRLI